ncbi:LacI family DNA-binding transcriptional regulator [Nonlabens agnitus]|uniref:LacI family transcriptional regulator n=1 Tax=Nonlabens agnitus TaxID=870484 RepID=A0A2S9WXF3_9FLAO|nr:LacI family DNA-binding transcriptional regulator [Nonlabens agnitus]PRP68056.1 LacI family transcriptional regulator [Nonlabens agnitus]
MKKKTTIYDIAAKLNLTAATVSRALNNNKKISENTRKLVKQTALEMNYEQNTLARALKSGKSFNVGVIVPRVDSNFFASVIRGIEEELYPKGYHVIICQTHNQEILETSNINSLLNAQVDGVLMSISNAKTNIEVFDSLLQKQVPLIFFDRKREMDGISSVTIDDFNGAYTATKHLIDQGCKKIAHLSNDRSFEIFKDRYAGYKQAILDHGLEFDESLVVESASKIDEGKRITKTFLEMQNRPDGIFSSSDFTALGAIQEIKAHGLRIPQDICVVGFSNEPFTRFMDLSISSVDQSPIEMGRLTAQAFLEEVSIKKKLKVQKKIVLQPELIIRKSSTRY